jgi:hypothetical protein
MQDYINCLAWVCRISDIIPKIQNLNSEIKIDHSNYKEIFSNLDGYIEIDNVILNTEQNPFLSNLCSGAVNFPEHKFDVFFADCLTKDDVKKFNLCREENNDCDHKMIRSEIFYGLSKFFEKAEFDLNHEIKKTFTNNNYNLHFINLEEAQEKALANFQALVEGESNKDDLIKRFESALEHYKNLENSSLNNQCKEQSMSYKVDLLKILGFISGENQDFLVQDFDRLEYSNLDISEKSKNFPKFHLGESEEKFQKVQKKMFGSDQKINSFWIPEQIFYLPDVTKKLFCMLFEHCMFHLDDYIKIAKWGYGVGSRFEVLFEYLDSKSLKTNEDIENFIKNTSYNDMYDEFDRRCEEFKNRTIKKFNKVFEKTHMNQWKNFDNNMHLVFENGKIYLSHMPNSKDIKFSSSWSKSFENMEKMSSCKSIFDQISSGLSFL